MWSILLASFFLNRWSIGLLFDHLCSFSTMPMSMCSNKISCLSKWVYDISPKVISPNAKSPKDHLA